MRDNFVKLIWNNPIKIYQNMFRRYYDTTEFDFSELDTSLVTNMFIFFWYFTGYKNTVKLEIVRKFFFEIYTCFRKIRTIFGF